MSQGPRSWAAGIVGFSLAVFAACYLLSLAADFLRHALPVLVPVGVVIGVVVALLSAWRWWRSRYRGW